MVRQRAGNRCEYCLIAATESEIEFAIDHVIARQHRGSTELSNLALACPHCNLKKGPNLYGIDPLSGAPTPLFHPRRHKWSEHFSLIGPRIVGRTAIGRTTLSLLGMNDEKQLRLRTATLADQQ